jgi:hypothetical protein
MHTNGAGLNMRMASAIAICISHVTVALNDKQLLCNILTNIMTTPSNPKETTVPRRPVITLNEHSVSAAIE